MGSNVIADSQYREWVKELKQKVRLSQLKGSRINNFIFLTLRFRLGLVAF